MKNNKGFSLVELIIVIAIMAILVGVMAPQLIRYIDKTNQSSDVQLLDSVKSAVQTAMLDPDVVAAGGGFTLDDDGNATFSLSDVFGTDKIGDEVSLTLGEDAATDVEGQLKSKAAKGQTINVQIVNSNKVIVTAGTLTVGDGSTATDGE